MKMIMAGVLACAVVACGSPSNAETPDEWIALGARVHGAFGAFIPVGIKIGLDAVKRLNAKPRELTVLYYDSDSSPCACFADGIAIATYASVGQRSLTISPEKAPADAAAVTASRWPGLQVHHPDSSSREAWADEQRP
jgi:formylmethanofuran dehydrogenase subunit E